MKNHAVNFLKRNGFERMERNSYANKLCNVVYTNNHFVVSDNYGNDVHGNSDSLYWLIGILTYHDFICRNFKK